MQDLLQALTATIALDADDLQKLPRFVKAQDYAAGEHVFNFCEACNDIYYIVDGLVRCYYLHNGKEVNLRLLCQPSAALPYASFLNAAPASEAVQALLPCRGYRIRFRELIRQSQPLLAERLQRVLAERHYLSMERRLLMLQHKSAEQRYAFFVRHMEARIVADTPDYHVASYLGITPVSLSRVKHHKQRKKPAKA